MDCTFITIHDLSPDAIILYCSDSIVDILGYAPTEVIHRPCWEFFHPEEIPIARAKHNQTLALDKAASLNYCRMRDNNGNYVGCEVVFTVVYDCLVGCISIYRRGLRSQKRAAEAPVIRRLFASSPRDPRYHMLSHLSSKFATPSKLDMHEPRAALFLNRYTRTLTIMYATDGLARLLGITGEEMRGLSFYYCIQEDCLPDAVRCLENAKENDSLAYLRFWYRDPFGDSKTQHIQRMDMDEAGDSIRSSDDDSEMSGVRFNESVDGHALSSSSSVEPSANGDHVRSHLVPGHDPDSRTSSGNSAEPFLHDPVFDENHVELSSASSLSNSPYPGGFSQNNTTNAKPRRRPIELEAVISCTSDGMVVCLRLARPLVPTHISDSKHAVHSKSLCAVPWSLDPLLPLPYERGVTNVAQPACASGNYAMDQGAAAAPQSQQPVNSDFMQSIKDIAIFAWALLGINGSLAEYGNGKPCGEAQPPTGLPVWEAEANQRELDGGEPFSKKAAAKFTGMPTMANSHATQSPPNFSQPLPHESMRRVGEDSVPEQR